MDGKPFHGATGTRFVPVSQDEIDERNNFENVAENYGYLWQEAVESGCTIDSQEDYLQAMIDDTLMYNEFFGQDNSYVHLIPDSIKKEYFSEYITFTCTGGGRMFPMKREDMKVIFNEDLFQAVTAIEELEQPLEVFQEILGGILINKGA